MAKKENFDFETENKFNLDFSFFKNLTQKQKETILMIAIAVVAVIVIVVIGVIVLTGGSSNGGNNNGGNDAGGTGDVGGENSGDGSEEGGNDVPDTITDMYITTIPTKTTYYVGDVPDYSGLVVNVKNDGTITINYTDHPEDFTITGFDSSSPAEEQVITVECRGITDTFTVTILEKLSETAVLESIFIDPMPKTEYKLGEMLDLSGAKINAVYSDGSVEVVSLRLRHIAGFESATTVGEHVLTVGYFDDHGGYAETTFTITVTE